MADCIKRLFFYLILCERLPLRLSLFFLLLALPSFLCFLQYGLCSCLRAAPEDGPHGSHTARRPLIFTPYAYRGSLSYERGVGGRLSLVYRNSHGFCCSLQISQLSYKKICHELIGSQFSVYNTPTHLMPRFHSIPTWLVSSFSHARSTGHSPCHGLRASVTATSSLCKRRLQLQPLKSSSADCGKWLPCCTYTWVLPLSAPIYLSDIQDFHTHDRGDKGHTDGGMLKGNNLAPRPMSLYSIRLGHDGRSSHSSIRGCTRGKDEGGFLCNGVSMSPHRGRLELCRTHNMWISDNSGAASRILLCWRERLWHQPKRTVGHIEVLSRCRFRRPDDRTDHQHRCSNRENGLRSDTGVQCSSRNTSGKTSPQGCSCPAFHSSSSRSSSSTVHNSMKDKGSADTENIKWKKSPTCREGCSGMSERCTRSTSYKRSHNDRAGGVFGTMKSRSSSVESCGSRNTSIDQSLFQRHTSSAVHYGNAGYRNSGPKARRKGGACNDSRRDQVGETEEHQGNQCLFDVYCRPRQHANLSSACTNLEGRTTEEERDIHSNGNGRPLTADMQANKALIQPSSPRAPVLRSFLCAFSEKHKSLPSHATAGSRKRELTGTAMRCSHGNAQCAAGAQATLSHNVEVVRAHNACGYQSASRSRSVRGAYAAGGGVHAEGDVVHATGGLVHAAGHGVYEASSVHTRSCPHSAGDVHTVNNVHAACNVGAINNGHAASNVYGVNNVHAVCDTQAGGGVHAVCNVLAWDAVHAAYGVHAAGNVDVSRAAVGAGRSVDTTDGAETRGTAVGREAARAEISDSVAVKYQRTATHRNDRLVEAGRPAGGVSDCTRVTALEQTGQVAAREAGYSPVGSNAIPFAPSREEGKVANFDGETGQTADVKAAGGRARTGVLRTQHGDVHTPAFVFCGTRAAIKGLTVDMLREAGAQIMLANTYHLLAYPGPAVVERLGRLQHFTGWRGPMLTDSGGYQIFSLLHGRVADEIKGRRAVAGREGRRVAVTRGDKRRSTAQRVLDCEGPVATPRHMVTAEAAVLSGGSSENAVSGEASRFSGDVLVGQDQQHSHMSGKSSTDTTDAVSTSDSVMLNGESPTSDTVEGRTTACSRGTSAPYAAAHIQQAASALVKREKHGVWESGSEGERVFLSEQAEPRAKWQHRLHDWLLMGQQQQQDTPRQPRLQYGKRWRKHSEHSQELQRHYRQELPAPVQQQQDQLWPSQPRRQRSKDKGLNREGERGGSCDSSLVVRISEEGVTFRSYYTGDLILLTPEKAIEAQYQLGNNYLLPCVHLPDCCRIFSS